MVEKKLTARAQEIQKLLQRHYPDSECTLDFKNPLELLVATILAAQCTDARVNIVTPALFKKYKTAKDYADADIEQLEEDIRTTGFYHNKAKSLKACGAAIVGKHKGKVPKTLDELVALPGVGRKTANVILGNAYDTPGIVVDTHVTRVSQRIGLTKNSDPVKIEFDLMELFPQKTWTKLSHQIVEHGRTICMARKPLCPTCFLLKLCDFGSKSAGQPG